jgi:hypothetical protein
MSMKCRFLRLAGFAAAVAVAGVLLFAGALLLPVVAEPEFQARRGELADAHKTGRWVVPGGRIEEISLTSTSGLAVELALRLPDEPLPGRPLLIMLSGQETGRKAVELLPDTRGVAVAALTYPFGTVPHRDGLALTLALRRIQRGIVDTPPAVLLAADYLLARPDLAPGRVELAGISFGAYLAAVPAALEPRIERLWLIHGSGDPQGVIEAGLRKRIGVEPIRRGVAWFLATAAAAHHLSPEHWVARVAPRPLIVVNAAEDSSLPAEAVNVLHQALKPPFEVLWSPGDHVHPKRPETIDYITDLLFQRISATANTASPELSS